jgi:hypothetical protein
MNRLPLTPYTAPGGMSFGFTQPPEDYYYNPSLYNYTVSPEGKILGLMKPNMSALNTYRGRGVQQGSSFPARQELPEPTKPTPRLIPSERRALAKSAAVRGFSSVSSPPKIASKMVSDVERKMMEEQEQRIRDNIISEILSRYMNPSRVRDYREKQDDARQLEMLQRMYGGGVA